MEYLIDLQSKPYGSSPDEIRAEIARLQKLEQTDVVKTALQQLASYLDDAVAREKTVAA